MKQHSLIFYVVLLVFSTLFSHSPNIHAADHTTDLEDGEYDIAFELWEETEDEKAEIKLNEDGEAKLFVEDDENEVQITLNTDLHFEIEVQENQSGSFDDDDFISIDIEEDEGEESEGVRKITFSVGDLKEPLNAKVYLIEEDEQINREEVRVRFKFDEPEKVEEEDPSPAPDPDPEEPDPKPDPDPDPDPNPKPEPEPTPEPETPIKPSDPEKNPGKDVEKGKFKNGIYDLPFNILKDDSNELSMTNDFVASPAQLKVKGEQYTIQMTLKNSSWWKYFKVQTGGSYKNVKVLSTNTQQDTQVVEFTVKDLEKVLNAKVHLHVKEINYEHKYDIRFIFDTSKLPLRDGYKRKKSAWEKQTGQKSNNEQNQHRQYGKYNQQHQLMNGYRNGALHGEVESEGSLPVRSSLSPDAGRSLQRNDEPKEAEQSESDDHEIEKRDDEDSLDFDRDADEESMPEKDAAQEDDGSKEQSTPHIAGLNTGQIILFSTLLVLSIALLIIQVRRWIRSKKNA